jgi:hypothetical protein
VGPVPSETIDREWGVQAMPGKEEQEVEQYLAKLLGSNDLEELDSWMQIISSAEQRMSPEVVINALLCLSNHYKKQDRRLEAETAYARAIALFHDAVIGEQW